MWRRGASPARRDPRGRESRSCTRAAGSSLYRAVDAARSRTPAEPVRVRPLHLEPEPLQLAFAVGPVLAHLDPELEMHALAEELAELLPRERARLLQNAARLADDDAFLAFPLDPDQSVHQALPFLVRAEMLDLDRHAVRHFLVHEVHELLADDFGDAKRQIAVRDHAFRELLRPNGQVREDLGDQPLEVVAGARRDRQELRERFAGQLVERRQQRRLARDRIDFVQHQERSIELTVEHLDERVVLARESIRLDHE